MYCASGKFLKQSQNAGPKVMFNGMDLSVPASGMMMEVLGSVT